MKKAFVTNSMVSRFGKMVNSHSKSLYREKMGGWFLSKSAVLNLIIFLTISLLLASCTDHEAPPTSTAPNSPLVPSPRSPTENRPPVLEDIGNQRILSGSLLEFTIRANDPDNDSLTYIASNLPNGASFDVLTRTFRFVPKSADTYENVVFSVTDGQATVSQTIDITVVSGLPPVENLIENVSNGIVPLSLIYYGDATPTAYTTILSIRPQYFICNPSHGLWGQISDRNSHIFKDISKFQTAGIQIIGYITAGYEGTKSNGNIGSKWYSLETNLKLIRDMAKIDGVDGVFMDECSAFPTLLGRRYLKELTGYAKSLGLITWGNVGRNDFDPWYFTEGGFDWVNSTEAWRARNLSKVQLDWGQRISVTGFKSEYTAQDAFNLTVNAWQKGLAYCYVTNANLGYNDLPPWLGEYADLLRKYVKSPEEYQPPSKKGNTTGVVASEPVPSGGYNEYNFTLRILDTKLDGIAPGQELWCASSLNDFQNLLTIGATLTGDLDNSPGWWVFNFASNY